MRCDGKQLSFRGKILCTYLLFILLTVIIFIILYIQGVTSAISYHVEYMQQASEQKNMSLDIAMGNHNSLNLLHYIDSKINIFLHETVHEMSAENRFERDAYLTKTLRLMAATNSNIRRISILTKKGDFYSSVSQNSTDYEAFVLSIISEIDWESRSQKYYTAPYPLIIGNVGYSAVTVIQQIADVGMRDNLAYLLLDLDFGAIAEEFNTIMNNGDMSSSFAIIGGDEVIYNSRNADLNLETELSFEERTRAFQTLMEIGRSGDRYDELDMGGIRFVAVVHQNEATGWYLVHYIPKEILLSNSMSGMIRVMLWVVGLLVMAGILSLILSKQVSKPIKKLSDVMSQAKQGQVRLYEEENKRTDEIGMLIDSYNTMGQRINDSIVKVYIAQLNQKQAELKMLQFQINPHFLYNALNTVTAIARLADVEEIPAITESLSDMFRYSVKGNDFVTLDEEITQLQNYLRIQTVRFPGRFVVEYEIPAELKEYGVIKFILQPIVENSIHHAFKKKRDRDCLKISARAEGQEVLLISVYDDGCGMTAEVTAEMNRRLAATQADTLLGEDGSGIGLMNVNARLKNFYGQEFGISVESEYGVFTCIRMRLKIRN